MVELQINTTQNVNINFTAASVGERILAAIIDLLIKVAYIIVIYQIGFNITGLGEWLEAQDFWSVTAVISLLFLPVMFYSLLFETLLDGQTPGKRVLKIKVVKIDGYQASIGDFFIRWIFRIVDFNLLGPLFGSVVGLIAIISSSKNQRLGDMTAGTSVITLKNNVNISHTILEDLKQDYIPSYSNVIKLSDNDARIIKDTFKTARKSKDYKTLIKLRAKIIEVLELKEIKHDKDHEFIDVILKDYNYYTQNM